MGAFAGRLGFGPRLVAMAMSAAALLAILAFAALRLTHEAAPATSKSAELQAAEDYGKLPLSFEPNAGRTDARADFISRGSGYSLFLTSTGAVMDLATSKKRGHALAMNLVGADQAAAATGLGKLPGTTNSITGDDASKWRQNLPTYERVRYEGVYPGIDVDWYGRQGTLEHDFRLAPGADPGQIKVRIDGADSLRLAPNGDLLIGASGKTIRQLAPVSFQRIDGERRPVASAYELRDGVVSFRLGEYDPSRPLIIDPIFLAYSTFLGGGAPGYDGDCIIPGECDEEFAGAIDFDYQGDAYIFGTTNQTEYPTTPGGYDTSFNGNYDAFVAKLSSSGTFLIYSTFIGGGSFDLVEDGIVDPQTGVAYVSGTTGGSYPTTDGVPATEDDAYAPSDGGGGSEGFVSRLSPSGSALTYSTYLGGNGMDNARALGLDDGDILVGGITTSSNFPVQDAVQPSASGGVQPQDGFISRLDPGQGTAGLEYSSYLGGGNRQDVWNLVHDPDDDITLVLGDTENVLGFPILNASDSTFDAGSTDGFVAAIDTEAIGAASLKWSTYLGGTGIDELKNGDIEASRDLLYVTGVTETADFPVVGDAHQATPEGNADMFLTLFGYGTGAPVVKYSTYFGGGLRDVGTGIAVEQGSAPANEFPTAYILGTSRSSDFPLTADAVDTTTDFQGDPTITILQPLFDDGGTPRGDGLITSTFFGSDGTDFVGGELGLDPSGQLYYSGATTDPGFPTTPGAFDRTLGTYQDATVTRFSSIPFIDGSPLNIIVNPRGHLSVSLDSEPGLEVDADANGAKAGLTLGFPSGHSQGVFGANGQFVPVGPPELEVNGNVFRLSVKYTTSSPAPGNDDPLITETVTYVNGETTFTTDYKLENVEAIATSPFRATVAADLSTDLEDQGVGHFDPGPPRFVGSLSDPYQTGDGLEEIRGWSAYEEGAAGNIVSDIQAPGGPGLGNTADEGLHDTASAAQWDDRRSSGLPVAASDTFQVRWAFRRVPRPVHGQRVVVRPVSGNVRVDAPTAAPINLEDPRRVPVGTEIDTTNGVVELVAERGDGAEDSANFWDGLFLAQQNAAAAAPMVAKLSGPCGRGGKGGKKGKGKGKKKGKGRIATAAAGGSRKLWGKGTGKFRTTGFRGSATVRGTHWLTTDRCKGKDRTTTFRVLQGVLAIDDFTKKKRVNKVLRRGSYTAK